MSGERGSERSVQTARHDDDDMYTSVQSQVESYHMLKKWYLMPPCLTQHYHIYQPLHFGRI